MLRLMAVTLAGFCLLLAGCNEADTEEAETVGAEPASFTAPEAATPEVMADAMMAEPPPGEAQDFTELTEDEAEFERYATRLIEEMCMEYGTIFDREAGMLTRPDGSVEPTPIADLIAEAREAMAEGGVAENGLVLSDPNDAVRYVLDKRYRPDMFITGPPGGAPPPQPDVPADELPEMIDPAEEQLKIPEGNTRQQVVALAEHYGLGHDEANDALTGEGFPAEGVPVSAIVSKVELNLKQRGEGEARMEAEVRAALSQLAEAGRQKVTKAKTDKDAQAGGGEGAPVLKNYYPEPDELIHPAVIYGDWQSVREDHPRHSIDHDAENFDIIMFRYKDTAVFESTHNGETMPRTEFPYRYDPRSGVAELIGTDGQPLQTMTVWATAEDPLLIWVQKESSRTRVLYEKKGRGGEPVTLDDEVEGVRIMLGDEEAEAYRQREEAKGRR